MRKNFKTIVVEFFYVSTAALAIFSALETIKPRSVLNYFNLNILLIIWLLNAIILLLIKPKK